MEFLGMPDVSPLVFFGLPAASFLTAFLGVSTGAAGGLLLLAIMATVLPPAMLIPLHTVVQLGSNVSRAFILVVTWMPRLGRIGAERTRFLALGFATTFLGMFVSATGTLLAPLVAGSAPNRHAQVATFGVLMMITHIAKLAAFGFLGFAIGRFVPLMAAMIATGALGNWIGERALDPVSEGGFKLVFRSILTLLGLRLVWLAVAELGWF